jgi:hypothetical protein
MHNILVTDRFYPHDPEFPHEFQYLLTDIGEGKVLRPSQQFDDPTTAHRASYGAIDFRAPEVHGSQGWSAAAEVFSFAVMACKIFDLRRYVCRAKPPDELLARVERDIPGIRENAKMAAMIVPAKVREAVEPCLLHLPGSRPTIREVIRILDELTEKFTSDKMVLEETGEDEKGQEGASVKWTSWDWNKSLIEGRLGTAERSGAVESMSTAGEDEFAEFNDIGSE